MDGSNLINKIPIDKQFKMIYNKVIKKGGNKTMKSDNMKYLKEVVLDYLNEDMKDYKITMEEIKVSIERTEEYIDLVNKTNDINSLLKYCSAEHCVKELQLPSDEETRRICKNYEDEERCLKCFKHSLSLVKKEG